MQRIIKSPLHCLHHIFPEGSSIVTVHCLYCQIWPGSKSLNSCYRLEKPEYQGFQFFIFYIKRERNLRSLFGRKNHKFISPFRIHEFCLLWCETHILVINLGCNKTSTSISISLIPILTHQSRQYSHRYSCARVRQNNIRDHQHSLRTFRFVSCYRHAADYLNAGLASNRYLYIIVPILLFF